LPCGNSPHADRRLQKKSPALPLSEVSACFWLAYENNKDTGKKEPLKYGNEMETTVT